MKKEILILSLAVLMGGCGSEVSDTNITEETKVVQEVKPAPVVNNTVVETNNTVVVDQPKPVDYTMDIKLAISENVELSKKIGREDFYSVPEVYEYTKAVLDEQLEIKSKLENVLLKTNMKCNSEFTKLKVDSLLSNSIQKDNNFKNYEIKVVEETDTYALCDVYKYYFVSSYNNVLHIRIQKDKATGELTIIQQ